ncbi:3-hydroxyacyl-CoA dehydrogenase, partial [Pseudomonas aeruginosa]
MCGRTAPGFVHRSSCARYNEDKTMSQNFSFRQAAVIGAGTMGRG